MRIGVIRAKYTPFGGAEVFLSRFVSELERRGCSVEIFASRWEGNGAKVHKVKAWGPSFLRPIIFAVNARKAVEAAKPDVVLSMERTWCQDIYRAGDGCHREWLERRAQTVSPLKRLLIRLNPLHWSLLYIEKRLFTSARLKYVVANSRSVKDDIIRHYGLPGDRIYVIYNGINVAPPSPGDHSEIRRLIGAGESTRVLLFVGSGFERKGLRFAIEALGLIKDKDVMLAVIGKGKTGEYEALAASLGVREKVRFLGPRKDARRFYHGGDIFVLPTIYEPFSNACLEAMAAGLPVVTTRVNGASEIIEDGITGGIIEDPADTRGLADKISIFLDRKKRDEAGAAALEVSKGFTIERCVGEFLKVIEAAKG